MKMNGDVNQRLKNTKHLLSKILLLSIVKMDLIPSLIPFNSNIKGKLSLDVCKRTLYDSKKKIDFFQRNVFKTRNIIVYY